MKCFKNPPTRGTSQFGSQHSVEEDFAKVIAEAFGRQGALPVPGLLKVSRHSEKIGTNRVRGVAQKLTLLQPAERFSEMKTPWQFSVAPQGGAKTALAAGYAFHGSPLGNWFGIIERGFTTARWSNLLHRWRPTNCIPDTRNVWYSATTELAGGFAVPQQAGAANRLGSQLCCVGLCALEAGYRSDFRVEGHVAPANTVHLRYLFVFSSRDDIPQVRVESTSIIPSPSGDTPMRPRLRRDRLQDE